MKRLGAIKRRHFRFAAARKRSIPKKIRAAGLDNVLKQMMDQHKDKVSKLADNADEKQPEKFAAKADKLKDKVNARFEKKKSALQKQLEAVKLKKTKAKVKKKTQSAFQKALKSKKLKKVFKKEANRKDHLERLTKDKAYYAANFRARRRKYAKK